MAVQLRAMTKPTQVLANRVSIFLKHMMLCVERCKVRQHHHQGDAGAVKSYRVSVSEDDRHVRLHLEKRVGCDSGIWKKRT